MLDKFRARARALCAKYAHKGEHAFHTTYLGTVAYEAHGNYRWAALACLVCVVASYFAGED